MTFEDLQKLIHSLQSSNSFFETDIEQEYESHVVLGHTGGKPCYPSKADLDIYNGNTRER